MWNLIVGNGISAVSKLCLAASMRSESVEKTYRFQMLETALCIAASLCFGSWSGISTLIISFYRNLKVCRGDFNKRDLWVTSLLTVVVGLLVNNRGLLGLMPIVAAIQLSWVYYSLKTVESIRLGLLVNTLIWMCYSFMLCDFASGIGEGAAALSCLNWIFRNRRRHAAPLTRHARIASDS